MKTTKNLTNDFVLKSTQMIWDHAPHNAFTDLIKFKEHYFIAFRESDGHEKDQNGKIRILKSPDCEAWESVALLSLKGVDLRDPKFSITPKGDLMVLMGGLVYDANRNYQGRKPRVIFSKDGLSWANIFTVGLEGEWIWQLDWHQGIGYGISYRLTDPGDFKKEWEVNLFSTQDGKNFKLHAPLPISGKPNEGVLRFLPDGTAWALIRREGEDKQGQIGVAKPPYQDWKFHPCGFRIGGPDFKIVGDFGVVGTRIVTLLEEDKLECEVFVGILTPNSLNLSVLLPSGGDTGYPGVWVEGKTCLICYYSSHEEEHSKIYLSKLKLRAQ